jgi:hypothetical protein
MSNPTSPNTPDFQMTFRPSRSEEEVRKCFVESTQESESASIPRGTRRTLSRCTAPTVILAISRFAVDPLERVEWPSYAPFSARSQLRDAHLFTQPDHRAWRRAELVTGSPERLRREVSPFPLALDALAQLVDRVGVPSKRKPPCRVHGKKLVGNHRRKGRVGVGVPPPWPACFIGLEEIADQDEAIRRTDFDVCRFCRWMDVNEPAAGLEQPPRPLQGMDHALARQSSQEPGQEHHVHAVVGDGHVFESDRPDLDMAP